jgi:hypothetical protein
LRCFGGAEAASNRNLLVDRSTTLPTPNDSAKRTQKMSSLLDLAQLRQPGDMEGTIGKCGIGI